MTMDLDPLISLLRSAQPPRQFTLTLDGQVFQCTALLRHLPGKRLVCAGTLDGRAAVAKLYVDASRASVHAAREERGARAMIARGILAAPLLATGALGNVRAVVYEFIGDASTALDAWHNAAGDDIRHALLGALARTVANHHNAGLLQEDAHLGNFLLKERSIYTLDAAAITVHDKPIGRSKALDNLALLCAQVPAKYDAIASTVLDSYADARSAELTRKERLAFPAAIKEWRDKRECEYLSKTFRESSAFIAHKRFDRYWVCDRSAWSDALALAMEDPDRLFSGARTLKRGNTTTVVLVKVNGMEMAIKRYNIKNPLHALKRAFQPTRAARSWRAAHLLRFHGLATPKPLALVEHRAGPLRRTSYLFTEMSRGENLIAFMDREELDDKRKIAVARRIVEYLHRMRAINLSHGDMKATNILIEDDEPILIDLDAMQKHRLNVKATKALERDILRFMQNWKDKPTVAAFFRELTGPAGGAVKAQS